MGLYRRPPALILSLLECMPPYFSHFRRLDLILRAVELRATVLDQIELEQRDHAFQCHSPVGQILEQLQAVDLSLEEYRLQDMAPVRTVEASSLVGHPDWLRTLLKAPGAPQSHDVYEYYYKAHISAKLCATRIILHQATIKLLQHRQQLSDEPMSSELTRICRGSLSTLVDLVNTICRCLVSHLYLTTDQKPTAGGPVTILPAYAFTTLGPCMAVLSIRGLLADYDPAQVSLLNWVGDFHKAISYTFGCRDY